MSRVKIDGLDAWWEWDCPECHRSMSFLDGASLAFCTWCHEWFDVTWERCLDGRLPVLSLMSERTTP